MRCTRWLACVVVTLAACGGPAPGRGARTPSPPGSVAPEARHAARSGELRGLAYTFRIDPALTTLAVELCLEGKAPARLVYGARSSAAFVRAPRLVSLAGRQLASARPLALREDGQLDLAGVADDACIALEVDLRGALERGSFLQAYRSDAALITSVELFLWRPPVRPRGLTARARFELPAGVMVSVPWPRADAGYVLDESVFTFTGHAVFGRFAQHAVEVPGGALDVVLPGQVSLGQRELIARWLASAARVVSLVTGRFPVERAQVIVVPGAEAGSELRFGHTGRSGGASILLFTPSEVTLAMLRRDWVAIHEFCHLLHPFVRRPDAWLSEGLATYLQEVLRVRAGLLDANEAWRRLDQGARLGAAAEGSLAEESRRMPHAFNYQRVYWAGAAIALMADVELRKRSEGRASLDDVLTKLGRHAEVMVAPASAASLIDALDDAAGAPVFHEISARYLRAARMPELEPLYRALGLSVGAAGLARRADAPLAGLGAAIMAPKLARSELPLFVERAGE